jgi:MerR family transcriptional regulator, light-induced transcriptional regulator
LFPGEDHVRQKVTSGPQSSDCEAWTPSDQIEVYERVARNAKRATNERHSVLEKIIENQVIPRLLLSNAQQLDTSPATKLGPVNLVNKVDEFAEIVINRDAGASIAYFEALRDEGASLESLFQDLLAPAARRLGVLWDEDINDFLDVTRGFIHLHQIVREFSDDFKHEGRRPASNRRALLMPLPGEHHTFGVALIGEQFRREGWRVWGGPPQTIGEILELVDGQWFDIVGLSKSDLADPSRLEADIRAIRQASHNSNVKVLIGGRVFAESPELAVSLGADATAIDGRQAVVQVQKLIGTDATAH